MLAHHKIVISTEAMDSFTVHGAVERPPHFAFAVASSLPISFQSISPN
jgi:hypothetical protein